MGTVPTYGFAYIAVAGEVESISPCNNAAQGFTVTADPSRSARSDPLEGGSDAPAPLHQVEVDLKSEKETL